MRKKLIAGNWKMNLTLADAYLLAGGVMKEAESFDHTKIVLCPPAVWLGLLSEHTIHTKQFPDLHLGAQNMHFKESGAYTGEISPLMVKEVAEYVILGHSERTHLFKESVAMVGEKLRSAFEHQISPILCIGEDEKVDGSIRLIIQRLNHLLAGLSTEQVESLVVAYEPVWAIGTGNPATPEYAQAVAEEIRRATSVKTRILYGGSVDLANAKGFLEQADIDGLLIGGTSLKLNDFLKICKCADDLAIENNTRYYKISN